MMAFDRGWDVLEPIDLLSGWDLQQASVRKKALEYITRERPDLVVVLPGIVRLFRLCKI